MLICGLSFHVTTKVTLGHYKAFDPHPQVGIEFVHNVLVGYV